jgi:hypothetical protein
MNAQANHCMTVDARGCGKVDNRTAQSGQASQGQPPAGRASGDSSRACRTKALLPGPHAMQPPERRHLAGLESARQVKVAHTTFPVSLSGA